MIHVMIVEDSPSVRMQLQHILESDPDIKVVASLESGESAIRLLKAPNPPKIDLITMDIIMPGMDGFTATRHIMETHPKPIIIVSAAFSPDEAQLSFKAIEAGAVTIIRKPVGLSNHHFRQSADHLIETVKLMSEVRVVTRFSRNSHRKQQSTETGHESVLSGIPQPTDTIRLMVIGSSTGGPPVLNTLLGKLPGDIPVPILIVQHISPGFIEGMARWLETNTGFPVHIPKDMEQCLPGHVYLAPDDYHIYVTEDYYIRLTQDPPENGERPSVSYLFRQTSQRFPGRAIAILLTGMGKDGAWEMKLIKESGSVTIAQDEKSCVVFGMPGEAVKLGAVDYLLPTEDIPWKICQLLKNGTHK